MKSSVKTLSITVKRVALSTFGVLVLINPIRGLASVVTVNQFLQYSYSYLPKCTSFDQFGACTSIDIFNPEIDVDGRLENTTLGQSVRLVPGLTHNAFRGVGNGDSLYAQFTTDVRPGQPLKTKTELFYEADNDVDPVNNDNLTDVRLRAVNSLNFFDKVVTDDPNGAIFRFETRITGKLEVIRSYGRAAVNGLDSVQGGLYPEDQSQPGAIYQNSVSMISALGGNINWGGALPELFETDQGGLQPLSFLEAEKSVDGTHVFDDIIYSGDPVDFLFDYTDTLALDVRGIDSPDSRAYLLNDLGNTITTFASVFDAEGNLIPDARVQSSLSGIEYDPLPRFANIGGGSGAPVPLPAPLSLIGLGLAAIGFTRKRKLGD